MDKILLWLFLAVVLAPPLIAVLAVLMSKAIRVFLASPAAWAVSALVLPHFASKAMDRMYDAFVAGLYPLAFVYVVSFLCIVFAIRWIVKYATHK